MSSGKHRWRVHKQSAERMQMKSESNSFWYTGVTLTSSFLFVSFLRERDRSYDKHLCDKFWASVRYRYGKYYSLSLSVSVSLTKSGTVSHHSLDRSLVFNWLGFYLTNTVKRRFVTTADVQWVEVVWKAKYYQWWESFVLSTWLFYDFIIAIEFPDYYLTQPDL